MVKDLKILSIALSTWYIGNFSIISEANASEIIENIEEKLMVESVDLDQITACRLSSKLPSHSIKS